ncbi:MAG TPA: hypothetical protein VFR23_24550 [Jiangellaceae bacterium]|nr:hypothetical protein [Jiangellaceae bacterium]
MDRRSFILVAGGSLLVPGPVKRYFFAPAAGWVWNEWGRLGQLRDVTGITDDITWNFKNGLGRWGQLLDVTRIPGESDGAMRTRLSRALSAVSITYSKA